MGRTNADELVGVTAERRNLVAKLNTLAGIPINQLPFRLPSPFCQPVLTQPSPLMRLSRCGVVTTIAAAAPPNHGATPQAPLR